MNQLEEGFFQDPDHHYQNVTAKELREIFIKTNGEFIAGGRVRTLGYKRLCPGLYRLFQKLDGIQEKI